MDNTMKRFLMIGFVVMILCLLLCGCSMEPTNDGICDVCGEKMVIKTFVKANGSSSVYYYCERCGTEEDWF